VSRPPADEHDRSVGAPSPEVLQARRRVHAPANLHPDDPGAALSSGQRAERGGRLGGLYRRSWSVSAVQRRPANHTEFKNSLSTGRGEKFSRQMMTRTNIDTHATTSPPRDQDGDEHKK
jgi:hypothetical protein